jgi:hypothetical protein
MVAACVQKQVGAVLTQEAFARVQSTWVTAAPATLGRVPSSRCLKVSRLRLSFLAVFFISVSFCVSRRYAVVVQVAATAVQRQVVRRVGAMQELTQNEQSIWVAPPAIVFGSVPSSRCRRVSRLRVSLRVVFFIGFSFRPRFRSPIGRP